MKKPSVLTRQGRAAGTVRVDRSEPLFQEAPVDRPRQLHRRSMSMI